MTGSEPYIHPALHNSEEETVSLSARIQAAPCPPRGESGETFNFSLSGRVWDARVQGHHDIGPKGLLYLNGKLRGEFMQRAVYMRPEARPIFLYLPESRAAVYLESAAVS